MINSDWLRKYDEYLQDLIQANPDKNLSVMMAEARMAVAKDVKLQFPDISSNTITETISELINEREYCQEFYGKKGNQ